MPPMVIQSKPGIKRDGTRYDGDYYVDGQWVRWQNGRPKKIGGYKTVTQDLTEVSSGLWLYDQNNQTFVHSGSATYLERFIVNASGGSSIITDRTPASLVVDTNNGWTFDTMFNAGGSNAVLIAHAAPNLADISDATETQVFYGAIDGTGALIDCTGGTVDPPLVSGGIVALHPYLFFYGNDGYITWSVPNTPNDVNTVTGGGGANGARVTGEKIVKGLPIRGGAGNAPAGLFWSLNSVVRATFADTASVFNFDTMSAQTSILAKNSPIEYDGSYYWLGTDRMLMFNGNVRETPNMLNLNYFYDNVNMAYANKVFSVRVPKYGEIWWCYPRGSATECTHAIVLNVRETSRLGEAVWYDTELPNGGRSAGDYSRLLAAPFMTGTSEDTSTSTFYAWRHEFGTDEVTNSTTSAVQSYFETADISAIVQQQAVNKAIRCSLVEPDFVQTGDMTMEITGRGNARAAEETTEAFTIVDPADITEANQQLIYPKATRRELRFRFESNTAGGNYWMGQCIAHIDTSDGRTLGGVTSS